MKATYGVDAPGLVRTFLLIGVALFSASAFIWAFAVPKWSWLAVVLLIPAGYALGMFALMLWESLVTKVKSREVILDFVPWTGSEAVLDVGCGRGLMLVGAARRLTTGKAIGVDIWLQRDQTANIKTAPLENAQIEGVLDRVSVETADMRKLPFADASFDVVVTSWVVHNLEVKEDRVLALTEMVRVLRPEGALLLTDIVNRKEYMDELERLGFNSIELFIASKLKDKFLTIVSFGAYQPATIIATKGW